MNTNNQYDDNSSVGSITPKDISANVTVPTNDVDGMSFDSTNFIQNQLQSSDITNDSIVYGETIQFIQQLSTDLYANTIIQRKPIDAGSGWDIIAEFRSHRIISKLL